jgi:hypothetical protein
MGLDMTPHGRRHNHAGGMPGFVADFNYYADHDLGVLLLSNWLQPSLLRLSEKVADIVLDARVRTVTREESLPAGLFFSQARAMMLEIDGEGVSWFMGERIPLKASDGVFHSTKHGDVFSIRKCGEGVLEVKFGVGEIVRFERWQAPLSPPANDLVGRYYNAQLDETHEVVWRDGRLEVRLRPFFRELSWSALTHRNGDAFSALIAGEPSETNLMLRFARDASGRVTGFFYSTYRCRDIWFERASA